MFENIHDYLKKHYSLKPTQKIICAEVIRTVKEVSGITLQMNEVRFYEGDVFIQARPAKRNEILLQRIEILTELKKGQYRDQILSLR